MKKRFLSILFILFVSNSVFAQSFDTDDTVKYVQKVVTAITPAHEYFQLYNNSGDSLPMRWKVDTLRTFYSAQWQIALQDNITYHNPIIDSSDFILPDTAGAMDKIIINIYPNGVTGYGELVIDLINLDSIADTKKIKFEIEIIPGQTGIDDNTIEANRIQIFPNPGNGFIQLESVIKLKSFSIIDENGKIIRSEIFFSPFPTFIDMQNLPIGIYSILLETERQKTYTLQYIKL